MCACATGTTGSKAHASEKQLPPMPVALLAPASAGVTTPANPSVSSKPLTPITHWIELLPRLKKLQTLSNMLDTLTREDLKRRSSPQSQLSTSKSVKGGEGHGPGSGRERALPPIPERPHRNPVSNSHLKDLRKDLWKLLKRQEKQRTIIQAAKHEADELWAEVVDFEKAIEGDLEQLRDMLWRVRESKPMVELVREKYAQRCEDVEGRVERTRRLCDLPGSKSV